MHQSDLYLPVPPIASRHVPPVRLPAAAPSSSTSAAWPQSFSNPAISKKRNIDRACDDCRRRKTRCDGPKMPDNVCTNCVQNRKICTYIETSKPRGPPKAYVTNLEDRVEKMEALLKRLRPETDFSVELGPSIVRGSWKDESASSESTPTGKKTATRPLHQFHPLSTLAPLVLSRKTSTTSDHENDTPSEPEDPRDKLIQQMKRLTLFGKGPQDKANRLYDSAYRFHGKSTHLTLVLAAREMKTRYVLETMGAGVDTITEELERVRSDPKQHARALESGFRRPEYWRSPDWELVYEGEYISSEIFSGLLQPWPPSDLAMTLIDLYFLHCNSMFPVLHRPTFARHFADRLYERDVWFACSCMSVFALASRYTDDLRVLLDEPAKTTFDEHPEQLQWQTAGYKYYSPILEVENIKRAILSPPSLFEIQTLCLMAQFQSETRWHRGAWYTVGVGIRKMQDIGAHTKQSYAKAGPTVENELWKRVWWYLNCQDRMQCAILGRPCATKEEDLNAEYPLEVDDDFWENDDPHLAFQQPPDKPSSVIAFNLWLRLTDFMASALHSFDIFEHDGPSSGLRVEGILNKLNKNLTEWAEKVPQHLKWSAEIEDVTLANQSATLYTTYNLITILLQRAFVPSSVALLSSPRDAQLSSPGLAHAMTARAVSLNAAKATVRILVIVHKRALSNVPLLLAGAEITIAVLCIDQWIIKAREGDNIARGGKLPSSAMQTIESHMQDVQSLLAALRWAAPRWETVQEKLAYLEKMVPEPDKEPDSLKLVSAPNVVQERQQGHPFDLRKLPQRSTATVTPLRPDISRKGSHASALADGGVATISSSTRHTRRQEEGPWLADLSRQYPSPQQTSIPSTPRISSSHLFLPRIRAKNPAEQPQRSLLDDWAGSQRSSYPMPPSLLTISGNPHPHAASDSDNSPEFARVKHESDVDPSVPQAPLRLGWEYVTHHPPSVPTWEATGVRASQNDAGLVRGSSRSSLLSHLHRPMRDFTAPSPYGTDDREPE
ncbi:fungal-specific transcription factor domain-containing protein [Russula dissimulans]|nr:fungal-specific transcription factor domain-containing protein [Russula dissimulans]